MIKKIAWETFKNTGDINTYLELKQIETIENTLEGNSQVKKINVQGNLANKEQEENIQAENLNFTIETQNINTKDFNQKENA